MKGNGGEYPGDGYYRKTLAAERLKECYRIAPERVKQYLEAELEHVRKSIGPGERILDLGCGYGRTIPALLKSNGPDGLVVGIDTSFPSLVLAKELLDGSRGWRLLQMDAAALAFQDDSFDKTLCIQNGISAFHVEQRMLIQEALRVTRPGGRALFSTYSEKFWPHRLDWFLAQSRAGLLGRIDRAKTGNGVIVCEDGFVATTVSAGRFLDLTAGLPVRVTLVEVDESSLFCELVKTKLESGLPAQPILSGRTRKG